MKTKFPLLYELYMKIQEPRVYRLLQLGVYICLGVAGLGVSLYPPASMTFILGSVYLQIYGWALFTGSVFASVAILPGIWWLERVGLVLLITSLAIYITIAITLHASSVNVFVSIAFILRFIQRWYEIHRWMLEPRIEED